MQHARPWVVKGGMCNLVHGDKEKTSHTILNDGMIWWVKNQTPEFETM